MNKIISSIAGLALVVATAAISPAQAASISISAASANDDTLAITVSGLTGNIAVTDTFNVIVRTLDDATAVDISAATAIHGDNGSFAESAYSGTGVTLAADGVAAAPSKVITITKAGAFTTAEDYFVTVRVASGTQNLGDFGATTVIKSTQNQISVSATVEPVLTFSVAGGNVDFGSLNPTGDNAAVTQTTISFLTNATSGIVVSGSAVGADAGATAGALGISGTANVIPAIASETDPAAFDDNAEYFAVEPNTLNASVGTIKATNDFSSADGGVADRANDLNGTTAIVNSNSVPINASFKVKYHIGIIPTTDAGTYTGTVTYTAAPTF